ncbi:MAG: hypothetical protein ACFBZ8_11280 [Opitutales bacterium]
MKTASARTATCGVKFHDSQSRCGLTAGFASSMLFVLSPQVQIFLAAIAGWMNRKQQEVIEYLLEENRVLKQQFDATGKKLRLTFLSARLINAVSGF